MFCSNCGFEMEEGTIFCPNCGTKLDDGFAVTPEDEEKTFLLEPEASQEQTQSETQSEGEEKALEEEPADGNKKEQEEAENEASAEAGNENDKAEVSNEIMVQTVYCSQCGSANSTNDTFCQNCGMRLGDYDASDVIDSDKKTKKKVNWLFVGIGAACIAILLLAGFAIKKGVFTGGAKKGKAVDYLVYLKDNELTMAKVGKYEPKTVTEKFFDDEDDASMSRYVYSLVSYSKDGKYIFYPSKLEYDNDDSFDLYYRLIGKDKAQEEKIDSDVIEYALFDNNKVVYIKDSDDRKLYIYDGKESQKIASDVNSFTISDDGKMVLWRSTSEDDTKIYVQDTQLKKDKIKLDSDIDAILDYSENFERIVYKKNDKLYVMENLNDKESIASDVDSVKVEDIDGDMKIYYTKLEDTQTLCKYDFVDDDLLSQDEKIQEPLLSDYQTITYVDSFWGTKEKIETDDAYYDAQEAYSEKLQRDYWRENLKMEEELGVIELYCYDHKSGESTKLFEGIDDFSSVSYNMTAFYYVDSEKLANSVKFSDIAENGGEFPDSMGKKISEALSIVYLYDGEMYEIEMPEEDLGREQELSFRSFQKGQILYALVEEYDDDWMYTIYAYDYGSKNAKWELVGEEVAGLLYMNEKDICYVNDEEDLYYNGEKIDSDVHTYEFSWCGDGNFLYYTDVNKDGDEGTLKFYKDGESVKISDDVALGSTKCFYMDYVAFLTDYSFKKNYGDLNVYDGKEVIKVDDEVTAIIK